VDFTFPMKLSPSFPALRHCQRKAGERNKQRNSFSNLTSQKRERERGTIKSRESQQVNTDDDG